MRSLLDANVLIALFDPKHIHNARAHSWWAAERRSGWASCPLTENALVRIMSNPNYHPGHARFSAEDVVTQLTDFVRGTDHEFWPDDISLRDPTMFETTRILGPRQLTDLYLLALAAHHKGRLVTFDETLVLSAVPVAMDGNLCVI
ncbi:MAG: PIN domain-containing protein [Chloracidobacterium sp.]|nr:PIN domain-containing protein [Chloracidobacterium sp.]